MPRDMQHDWTVIETQSLRSEADLVRALIAEAGLDAAARASVASELAEEDAYAVDGPAQAPDLLELRDAMSLVWRILLLWLGVLALLVLAGWAT